MSEKMESNTYLGKLKKVVKVGENTVVISSRERNVKWSKEDVYSMLYLSKIIHLLFPLNTPEYKGVFEDDGEYKLQYEFIEHDPIHARVTQIRNIILSDESKVQPEKLYDELEDLGLRIKQNTKFQALVEEYRKAGLFLVEDNHWYIELKPWNIIMKKEKPSDSRATIPVYIDFVPAFLHTHSGSKLVFDPVKLIEYTKNRNDSKLLHKVMWLLVMIKKVIPNNLFQVTEDGIC